MKKRIIILGIIIALFPTNVFATSGFLKSDSIVTCNGVTYGMHSDDNPHWHVAVKKGSRWYSSGNPISSNPCPSSSDNNNSNTTNSSNSVSDSSTTNNTISTKSSDATLKSLTINDNNIEIKDTMNYTLSSKEIKISAETNDNKAKYDISDYSNLKNGDNKITIIVTAEDYTTKYYVLNIYKKSDNLNITIKYDYKEIKFNDKYESDTIKVSDSNIKFTINAEDSKTTTNLKDNYELENGKNKIVITTTAENGDKRKYTINVEKESVSLLDIITFIIIIIIVYYVYKYNKRQKEKQKK